MLPFDSLWPSCLVFCGPIPMTNPVFILAQATPALTAIIHRGTDAVPLGLGHRKGRSRQPPSPLATPTRNSQKRKMPSSGYSGRASSTPAPATPVRLTPIYKKNTASASPLVAQGKNDPARGVLTFVGLIGNPRLGCNPRSPR